MASSNPAYVTWVQRSLNRVLGTALDVDGVAGEQTRAAIRRFQESRGLEADGLVGPATERALLAAGADSFRFKDAPALAAAPLAPASPIEIDPAWTPLRRELAGTYNRLGGLARALGDQANIGMPSVLAVWSVESSGRAHTAGRAVIRFENHLLWEAWGRQQPAQYDAHFRHGGRAGQSGRAWERHQFREAAGDVWRACHTGQDGEYRVVALARRLAGDHLALACMSIGGPQILVSHYATLGYASPLEMFEAFQADERAQILGFFDFCASQGSPSPGDLLDYLRQGRWMEFARFYNGTGQMDEYAGRLDASHTQAALLPV